MADTNEQIDQMKGAIERGDLATVRALLDAGLDPGVRLDPESNRTFLMYCTHGNKSLERPDIARELITRGADINAQNIDGYTALMFAVEFDNRGMMDLLLSHQAKIVGLKGLFDGNAYEMAVKYEKTSAIERLRQHIPAAEGFLGAISARSEDETLYWLQRGVDESAFAQGILFATGFRPGILSYLLKYKKEKEGEGFSIYQEYDEAGVGKKTLLRKAIFTGSTESVGMILNEGFDPHSPFTEMFRTTNYINHSVAQGVKTEIQGLLNSHAQKYKLSEAIADGKPSSFIIELLNDPETDVNLKGWRGVSPLVLLIRNVFLDTKSFDFNVFNRMIERGARVNDIQGGVNMVLFTAFQTGREDICNALFAKGASLMAGAKTRQAIKEALADRLPGDALVKLLQTEEAKLMTRATALQQPVKVIRKIGASLKP